MMIGGLLLLGRSIVYWSRREVNNRNRKWLNRGVFDLDVGV